MPTNTTGENEVVITEEGNDAGDTSGESTGADTISIPKSDYEKLNQTLGSLKRELKDLKKSKTEETSSSTETTKTSSDSREESRLLEKIERMSLRQAGITHQDDMELARSTAKKWGVDIDEVLADEDFKVKLERQQASRSNVEATSGIKGSGGGSSQAKNSPEYWIAKGVPPSRTDVPDRATRAKIARAMMAQAKSGGRFYND
jgi:hypothetical protein